MRFGGPLSPEFFDKHLPPSTPLRKGSTPARAATPGGALRSALKTPQGSGGAKSPADHHDLDLHSAFGASPVLKMPRNRRMPSVGEDEDAQVRRSPGPPACDWPMEEMECGRIICSPLFPAARCSSGRWRRWRRRCRETEVGLPPAR